jgi:hypothetical protein
MAATIRKLPALIARKFEAEGLFKITEIMNIFPVYYFPSVSWFAAALQEKEIVLERHEFFRKQQFHNRTEIKAPDKVLRLSIPVQKVGKRCTIGEKQISNQENWRKDHWKSIESALRSSPYFEFYAHRIEGILSKEWQSLLELNLATIELVRDALRLDLSWTLSEQYLDGSHYCQDFRGSFDARSGQMPSWFKAKEYIQVFGDYFSPDLSILDLLCNKGPESVRVLRESWAGHPTI